MGLRDYYNNKEINSENVYISSIATSRENVVLFGIYNNPLNKNGGDVVDDEDVNRWSDLLKYSKDLEEDLEHEHT